MPVVSVIIPTYNRANYILDAVESVCAQTYEDHEIIVIDDGSTDHTRDVLQPLIDDQRIIYVHQENSGVSSARNHGIRLAQGKYVAFLDSDDTWDSTKLEAQITRLDSNPAIALVHNSFQRKHIDGTLLGSRDTSHITGWVYPEILLDWSVLIPPSCVILRKAVLDQIGGFDETLRWGEDIDLWGRVSKHYPLESIPEELTTMHVHGDNVSGAKTQLKVLDSFVYYLEKAFADDPQLTDRFRHKALAKVYSNFGHNVLADGDQEQMTLVRKYSVKAIQHSPLQISAYLGWIGSFIPHKLREGLLKFWRKYRYSE